jgi:lysozyme family protein
MVDLAALIVQNAARWAAAKPSIALAAKFSAVAARLCQSSAQTQYQKVAVLTTVPWYVIAVIHERECTQSWAGNIAQGDPWDRPSTHDPAGRGPFSSWQNAAVDALTNCAPYAAKWADWSAGGALTLLERYNGLGYAMRNVPSPYIWAGTDQYKSGKFTRDHYYDPDVIDAQLGCAGLLLAMQPIGKFTLGVVSAPPAAPESLLHKIEDAL